MDATRILFATNVEINFRDLDFFMRFSTAIPNGKEQLKVDEFGIFLSPQHAKILSQVLNKSLKDYEDKCGKIDIALKAVEKE
jgi:hydroxypyruvate isomerase